jgi:hypothetical protein
LGCFLVRRLDFRYAPIATKFSIAPTHLIPGGDNDPDNAYSDGVATHYAGMIVVAKDLMRF